MSASKCDECESAAPAVRCGECDQALCNSCSSRIHAKGARARHQLTAITVKSTPPPVVQQPASAKPASGSIAPRVNWVDANGAPASISVTASSKPGNGYANGAASVEERQNSSSPSVTSDPSSRGSAAFQVATVSNLEKRASTNLSDALTALNLNERKVNGSGDLTNGTGRRNISNGNSSPAFSSYGLKASDSASTPASSGSVSLLTSALEASSSSAPSPAAAAAAAAKPSPSQSSSSSLSSSSSSSSSSSLGGPAASSVGVAAGNRLAAGTSAPNPSLTSTRPKCAFCDRTVLEDGVSGAGKVSHRGCFNCADCGQSVVDAYVESIQNDGKVYCKADFTSRFSPKCFQCKEGVFSDGVTAMGSIYHKGCFRCANCSNPLQGTFFERDGLAYCETDYYKLFASECGGCGKRISGQYTQAMRKRWHPECFVCHASGCGIQLHAFHEHGGFGYCEHHHRILKGLVCSGCNQPIVGTDPYVTAIKANLGLSYFHPEHFMCSNCSCQLGGIRFEARGSKLLCETCVLSASRLNEPIVA